MIGFMVDDSDYSEYASDYSHLGNILTDLTKGVGSAVTSIWNAITPTIPAIAYKQATGRDLPPAQQIVYQQVEKPATPITTYLMYGGLALLAGMVIYKTVKR